jgi:hypothetical protein
MDKHGSATSHDAIPIRDVDAPYAGAPGQTRFESVHLVEPDGSLRTHAVCRAINTRTHPELKQRALAGLLHRFDDGRELALSYVYHDPDARKFALVLPASLAHMELKEWSRLMAEIAEDTRHPVPLYVRDNTTVIGASALDRYARGDNAEADESELESSPYESQDSDDGPDVAPAHSAEQERLLLQRERELGEQERSLIRMAEGLTAREGALNRLQEQLETARTDLEIRETELSERGGRAGREAAVPRNSGNWTEVGVARNTDNDATVVSEAPREAFAAEEDGSNAAEVIPFRTHPPPLPSRSRTGPPPLPFRQRMTPPPLLPRRGGSDEPRAVVSRPSEPPPLPNHSASQSSAGDKDPEPEVAPPAYFAGQRVGQMAVKLVADELWLFVHIEEERAATFRRGVDLMLQYSEIEAYPVLVMSLVSQSHEHAIRLALDGHSEVDLRVLEHLSRSFRARVALYIGGVYCETLTVAALREGVAQAISEKLAQLPGERSAVSSAEAMMRVLHAPPPLWNDDLPFGPARREASTTAAVLAAVEQLASWLAPAKLTEATLSYCVPRNVIDATIRRVLRAAVAFGVALPDELVLLAVEHRAATDERSLIRHQLQAFKQRVEHAENDLGATGTRKNWDALFAQAEARQVEVEDALRALATAPPRASTRPDSARPSRPFEGLPASELKPKLTNIPERLEAIRELCVRGHASSIELVFGVLDQLSRAELPAAVAQLLSYGEAAGDGLIKVLSGSNEPLRQLAALGLGRLRLRRALLPLLKQLEVEDSAIHGELARAIGDFGPAALRMVLRTIPGSARPERLVSALAHLANHGSAKEVEKLENDPAPEIAAAARKAMAKRSRMEWEDLAVRGQRTLGDADPAALLSQAFYAEVTKVAI